MKICSALPSGDGLYRAIQKTFGRLKSEPMSRIPLQIEMAKWILDTGHKIVGKKVIEVGTGHDLVVPIGFFLCGAEKIFTVDLHRRLDSKILTKTLNWMSANDDYMSKIYNEVSPYEIFKKRMSLLCSLKDKPQQFLFESGISYKAPGDAARTELAKQSIDYHLSCTVLEHIPALAMGPIFMEAKRILHGNGLAVHFIDLSDHFHHTDPSISPINFLRFTEAEWQRIASNEFAYCNRLRASDYLRFFSHNAFEILQADTVIDTACLHSLQNGFNVDEYFNHYDAEDLCTLSLNLVLGRSHRAV